jgi:hypothetical protein
MDYPAPTRAGAAPSRRFPDLCAFLRVSARYFGLPPDYFRVSVPACACRSAQGGRS